ncbi:MAG: hypothetical protein RBS80_31375 [Thermoguttaceae bacterium]|nr:hypothetical protein [Thermoguttaceae bacterium]
MSMEHMPPQHKPEGATTIFVLGLLGLLVCAILGIFAWIQGNDYMKRCQAMGVEPDGLAVAGRIMGMIATVFIIIGLVTVVGMMMLGVIAGAAGM